jgi:hypothetical protein
MSVLKIPNFILLIGLILFICLTIILLVVHINSINQYEEDLNSLNMSLQENISKLLEEKEKLNSSESFINSYLNGLGYYLSSNLNLNKADYKYDEAIKKYDKGDWSSASAWFDDSIKWCKITIDEYKKTDNIFNKTIKYTSNETYQNICNIYLKMINTSSNATIYLSEASEFYLSVCEYYLDGNYDEARENRIKAEEKFNFYEDEMLVFEDYHQDLQNILIELS